MSRSTRDCTRARARARRSRKLFSQVAYTSVLRTSILTASVSYEIHRGNRNYGVKVNLSFVNKWRLRPTGELMHRLEELLGPRSVELDHQARANAADEAPVEPTDEFILLRQPSSADRVHLPHLQLQWFPAHICFYSHEEIVNLTAAIVTINSWNRIAVGFGFLPKIE